MTTPSPEPHGRGHEISKIGSNLKKKSSLLLPINFKEKLNAHGYNVHDGLYRNCDIHGLWVRGSSP